VASEQPRHQPEPASAEPALDEKGQALAALLKKSLKEFQPEIGASLDEVVVTVRPELVVEVGRKLKNDPETACDFLRCLSTFVRLARGKVAALRVELVLVDLAPGIALAKYVQCGPCRLASLAAPRPRTESARFNVPRPALEVFCRDNGLKISWAWVPSAEML